jgi:hypothetical protein
MAALGEEGLGRHALEALEHLCSLLLSFSLGALRIGVGHVRKELIWGVNLETRVALDLRRSLQELRKCVGHLLSRLILTFRLILRVQLRLKLVVLLL